MSRLGLRAQVWMGLVAARSLAYAYAYAAAADRLEETRTFEVVGAIAPIQMFALVFAALAVAAAVAAVTGGEATVRTVGVISVMFQLLFGLAIFAAWTWSPAGVSMIAIAGMDALALSMPFQQVPKVPRTE